MPPLRCTTSVKPWAYLARPALPCLGCQTKPLGRAAAVIVAAAVFEAVVAAAVVAVVS